MTILNHSQCQALVRCYGGNLRVVLIGECIRQLDVILVVNSNPNPHIVHSLDMGWCGTLEGIGLDVLLTVKGPGEGEYQNWIESVNALAILTSQYREALYLFPLQVQFCDAIQKAE